MGLETNEDKIQILEKQDLGSEGPMAAHSYSIKVSRLPKSGDEAMALAVEAFPGTDDFLGNGGIGEAPELGDTSNSLYLEDTARGTRTSVSFELVSK